MRSRLLASYVLRAFYRFSCGSDRYHVWFADRGLGSLGLWVFGYLGLWVFGSLGLWVFGSLVMRLYSSRGHRTHHTQLHDIQT
jgi:hypothetical protein